MVLSSRNILDISAATGVLGLSLCFDHLNMAMSQYIGNISDTITLGIQAVTLVYMSLKVKRLVEKKDDVDE